MRPDPACQRPAMWMPAALATFTQIVQRKPAFAEGWNKRATGLYLLAQDEASLRGCDEVLKRKSLTPRDLRFIATGPAPGTGLPSMAR